MRLGAEQRNALELLGSDRRDANQEALVFVQQFDRDTIAGLVRTGLATTQRAILKAGDKVIEVVHITITKAGRQAIEGCKARQACAPQSTPVTQLGQSTEFSPFARSA